MAAQEQERQFFRFFKMNNKGQMVDITSEDGSVSIEWPGMIPGEVKSQQLLIQNISDIPIELSPYNEIALDEYRAMEPKYNPNAPFTIQRYPAMLKPKESGWVTVVMNWPKKHYKDIRTQWGFMPSAV